jgi:ATP-dependent RNA helicase DeaD
VSDKTEHPPVPEAFAALGVRPSILRALADLQYITPSEIQGLLIPRALSGVDILGQARTGTGKTASFGIPILQMATKGLATQAIILVPTRELAVQVDEELKRIGQFTPIRSVPVFGGQKILAQMKFLKHHPEILVGTPGRVIDLLDRRIISFENIRFVVLDEVDRMLDIGFRDDIRNILSRIKGVRRQADAREPREPSGSAAGSSSTNDTTIENNAPAAEPQGSHGSLANSPSSHQTIFVSATISDEIDKLARRYMREPVEKLIAPGADDKPTVDKVEQYYISVQPWDKYHLLRMLLKQEQPELAIVFCRTKRGAEKIAKKLHFDGIECREIHGNLAQNKRDRVMKGFKGGKFDVLIATDLASRGIDVADISHIINYDIPEDPEAYVHRIGRTARMNKTGKAFTLVTKEQGDELTKVENLINMVIPVATVEGFEPRPTPDDWTEGKPGDYQATTASKPIVNRFERAFGSTGSAAPVTPNEDGSTPPAAPAKALPPRTIGSKIPVNRRHKRR